MSLVFVGIDPNTGQNESPTVWVDSENADIVVQSYLAGDKTRAQCARTTAPGHAEGIPEHETVVRIPVRLAPVLREACDAAERTQL